MSLISLNNNSIGSGPNTSLDDTASNFRNYFRSPLIIPPKSKLKFIGARMEKDETVTINLEGQYKGNDNEYPMTIWYRFGSGRTTVKVDKGFATGGAAGIGPQYYYMDVPRFANLNQNEDGGVTYPSGNAILGPQEFGQLVSNPLNQDNTIPAFMTGNGVPIVDSNTQLNKFANIYDGIDNGVGAYIHYDGQSDGKFEMYNIYNTIYGSDLPGEQPEYLSNRPGQNEIDSEYELVQDDIAATDLTYTTIDGEVELGYGTLSVAYDVAPAPDTDKNYFIVGARNTDNEAGSMVWARQPGTYIEFKIYQDSSDGFIDCGVGLTSPHWTAWLNNEDGPEEFEKEYYPNPGGTVYEYSGGALPMWFYVNVTNVTTSIHVATDSPAIATQKRDAGDDSGWTEIYTEATPTLTGDSPFIAIKICQPMFKRDAGNYYNLEVYLATSDTEVWGSTLLTGDGTPVTISATDTYSFPTHLGTLQPAIFIGPNYAGADADNSADIQFGVFSQNWDGSGYNETPITGDEVEGFGGGLIRGPIPLACVPQWDYNGNGLFGSEWTGQFDDTIETPQYRSAGAFNVEGLSLAIYNPQWLSPILTSAISGSSDSVQDPVTAAGYTGPLWTANVELQINTDYSPTNPSGGANAWGWIDASISYAESDAYGAYLPLPQIGKSLGFPNTTMKYQVFKLKIGDDSYSLYSYAKNLLEVDGNQLVEPVHIQLTNLPIRSYNGAISNLCKDIAVCFLNKDDASVGPGGLVEYEAKYPVEISLNNQQTLTLDSIDVLITRDNNTIVKNLTGTTEIVLQLIYP